MDAFLSVLLAGITLHGNIASAVQGTCTRNMRKEARLEEIVPQSEYQTDPARLVLPNALLIEGDPDLGFVPCVGRVLERAFKA